MVLGPRISFFNIMVCSINMLPVNLVAKINKKVSNINCRVDSLAAADKSPSNIIV